MGIFNNRKREEQLENIILKLEKENKELKNQVKKKEKAEWLDKELLDIAKKIDFKPLEVERYKPFRYYGNHTELRDKGTDENGVPQLEMVQVEDFDEEKRWTETITFEENPREYLDIIKARFFKGE